MDLHQLKTFVAVARERSITRASEQLHLSQPAVSAQIKALEDELGLMLFERTPRGMSLTGEGERILAKSERALAAQQDLMAEATRIKGQVGGRLQLGVGGSSNKEAIGYLITLLAERYPGVEVALKHGSSQEILAGVRNGSMDAGYYNEADEPGQELDTVEVSRFRIHLAAAPGAVASSEPLDWRALAELPWIYPTSSTCCSHAAEALFKQYQFRPQRVISVDRGSVTRSLIQSGLGLGLLHADAAKAAAARGEVELLYEMDRPVRILFATLASRAQDPLVAAARAVVRDGLGLGR
jgi:DNA-binding transcriptional LysR family regulator